MTVNEIMVLAWPAIAVAAMVLFGWRLMGWINRKHPKTVSATARLPSTDVTSESIRNIAP